MDELNNAIWLVHAQAARHEKKNGLFAAQGFHGTTNIAVGRSASGSTYALVQQGEKSRSFILDWKELPEGADLP